MLDKEYYLKLSKEAQDNYKYYKEEAETSICRREYTVSKRYDISPYWYGRLSTVPGEITEEETDTYYEFDNHDRLRISACDELMDGYAYTVYEDNRIITRLYVHGVLDSIKEYLINDGFIKRCIEYSARNDKLQYEDYIYEGERLIQVYQPQYESNSGYFDHLVRTYFEYDEKGILSRVLDGTKGVIYVKMLAEEVALLREEVKKGLIVALIEIIGNVSRVLVDRSSCFLAIFLHDEAHAVYSPMFQPGLQNIRDEQVDNKKDYETIWNSGEHPVKYQQELTDQELIQKLRNLIMFWHNTDDWWEEGMKLWQEVAYSLNETNWSDYSMLTEDFIVFVDREGLDVTNGELEKSIPLVKLELLRSKGLVPVH